MSTWRYFDANQGIHAYRWDTEYFKITRSDTEKIVLQYDPSLGKDFEEWRNPWRIVFNLTDATTFKPGEGPNAGESLYNGGSITEIRMFDQAGDLQIKVTNIDVPLAAVGAWYNEEKDFDHIFRYLDGVSQTHIGSDNGPRKGWDDYILKDEIRTGAANDVVRANGGNDYIMDFGGKDTYDGGAGRDQLSYDEWFWNPTGIRSGIRADLKAGTVEGPDGKIDSVTSIEQLRGTFLRDVMRGDAKDNEFQGMCGNDLLDGRGGWDQASYRNDDNQGGTAGIRANMKTGKVRDGFGNTDTLKSIEGVQGTDVRDIFRDAGKDHSFRGREGNDLFKIFGGDDWMRGDDGADTFKFFGNSFGFDHVDDYDPGEGDKVIIVAANGAGDLEILSQNGGNDTLVRLNGDSEVFLEGVSPGSVNAGDFIA